jgi:hypothetical protein
MKRKPVQKRAEAEDDEDSYEYRRAGCNLFKFWLVCPERRCCRAKSCVGDPKRCFDRWWPQLPEPMKDWFRAVIKALNAGMSPRDACRHAEAEVERVAEFNRNLAALGERPAAEVAPARAPDEPRHVPDERAPRIRSL